MRFAVAISIISHTLSNVVTSSDALPASSIGGIKEETKEQRTVKRSAWGVKQIQNDRRTQHRVPRHRHSLIHNSKPATSTNRKVECDPTFDAGDFGLLSCGAGRYCSETSSLNSSLGGVCADKNEITNLQVESKLASHRRQQVVGKLTFFELAETFCDQNQNSCDCSAMDLDAYKGEFSCNFDINCNDVDSGCTNENEGDETDYFAVCVSEVFTGKAESKFSYSYTSW